MAGSPNEVKQFEEAFQWMYGDKIKEMNCKLIIYPMSTQPVLVVTLSGNGVTASQTISALSLHLYESNLTVLIDSTWKSLLGLYEKALSSNPLGNTVYNWYGFGDPSSKTSSPKPKSNAFKFFDPPKLHTMEELEAKQTAAGVVSLETMYAKTDMLELWKHGGKKPKGAKVKHKTGVEMEAEFQQKKQIEELNKTTLSELGAGYKVYHSNPNVLKYEQMEAVLNFQPKSSPNYITSDPATYKLYMDMLDEVKEPATTAVGEKSNPKAEQSGKAKKG